MIQVGEVLDKYELLERVGQGGMAVVYRGIDRSLKRVVAVKILHKHLSDYQEARDRFEREAQAVAKLRHENILEIFDYSGADAAAAAGSSYIVTEFIDGQTLKQVITDRPIQFPEIGAMIVLQVCRALAHAHAAGILHRDVKPENIMIRSDGVVKLMDFGISHMLDLERLTVTGQLLGSPAYMAPEHVEGRQLDFRTDVFAAGIVLYQLTVGRLPFEGKNPHEVLKRIAECKFVDPRQANPMIGNRLGRIILRAMAASPSDRYPGVGEMVLALESYLDESGLAPDKVPGELSRYFQAPVAYEQALETRLVDHLTSRGQKLLADDQRSAALDMFDRVLTIDPDNEKVGKILDGINRRRRLRTIALGTLGVLVLTFCAYMVHRRSRPIDAEAIASPPGGSLPDTRIPQRVGVPDVLATPHPIDAGIAIVSPPDAPAPGAGSSARVDDAGVEPVGTETKIRVSPAKGSEVQIGSGPFVRVPPEDGWVARTLQGETIVRARNPCCTDDEQVVKPGTAEVTFLLKLKPASVTPKCARDVGVKIRVDGEERLVKLGEKAPVFFEGMLDVKPVTVMFISSTAGPEEQKIDLKPGENREVTCGP